jgi:hypothetical protein
MTIQSISIHLFQKKEASRNAVIISSLHTAFLKDLERDLEKRCTHIREVL